MIINVSVWFYMSFENRAYRSLVVCERLLVSSFQFSPHELSQTSAVTEKHALYSTLAFVSVVSLVKGENTQVFLLLCKLCCGCSMFKNDSVSLCCVVSDFSASRHFSSLSTLELCAWGNLCFSLKDLSGVLFSCACVLLLHTCLSANRRKAVKYIDFRKTFISWSDLLWKINRQQQADNFKIQLWSGLVSCSFST